MARPLVDRRRDVRLCQPELAGAQAIVRPGYSVSLVDLSAGGVLIQGPRPMRPGAHVYLQLMTGARRLALSGQVLRCSVAALDPLAGVQYRAAIQFDRRCAFWEDTTLDGYVVPDDDNAMASASGHGLPEMRSASGDAGDRWRQ